MYRVGSPLFGSDRTCRDGIYLQKLLIFCLNYQGVGPCLHLIFPIIFHGGETRQISANCQ